VARKISNYSKSLVLLHSLSAKARQRITIENICGMDEDNNGERAVLRIVDAFLTQPCVKPLLLDAIKAIEESQNEASRISQSSSNGCGTTDECDAVAGCSRDDVPF